MTQLSVEQTILQAKSHAKKGEIREAQRLYQTVLNAFPKNKRAQKGMAALNRLHPSTITEAPPQEAINQLANLYNQGQLSAVVEQAQALTEQYPSAFIVWNILGAANKGLGRVGEAVRAFQKVTELNPTYADGFNNLGVALQEQGKLKEAIVSFNTALSIKPDYADCYINLGPALQEYGKLDEALEAYNKAITLNPDIAYLHNNVGVILQIQNNLKDAIKSYHNALSLNPGYAEAHYNMGHALKEQGKLEEAIKSYHNALSLNPDNADAHNNVGAALNEQGKLEEAIEAYKKALLLQPDYAEAHYNLGRALQEQGKMDQATEVYKKTLSLKPDYAEAQYNMGNALQEQGKIEEATAAYKKAISLQSDYTEAYNNLGNALKDQGKLEEAVTAYNNVLSLKPDYAEAYFNIGNALKDQGKLEEAIEAYKNTLSLKPDYNEAYSNFIFCLDSTTFENADLYNEVAFAFNEYASNNAKKKFKNKRHLSSRIIRIGFVSGDLRDHPVGFFLENLFKNIDQQTFELIVYSNSANSSKQTHLLRQFTKAWRIIKGVPDNQVAEIIYKDEIDILIDLSGHTALNRLPVFAYRPCAIQATWLGYFGSTCLSEMDYILGDRYVIPIGTEHQFSEKFALLPDTYICFSPPDFDLQVSPTPAIANDFITFGCFNNASKVNKNTVVVWSEILRQTAGSKMIFKGTGYSGDKKAKITGYFRDSGIDAARITFQGKCPRETLLESYNNVDIALDPFPYTGGTTTCEALWMGVPTVTKTGNTFLTNIGQTIAINSGHKNLCCSTIEEYIDTSVILATNVKQLNYDRLERRKRVLRSPLFDGERFAKEFENLMQKFLEHFQRLQKND